MREEIQAIGTVKKKKSFKIWLRRGTEKKGAGGEPRINSIY